MAIGGLDLSILFHALINCPSKRCRRRADTYFLSLEPVALLQLRRQRPAFRLKLP